MKKKTLSVSDLTAISISCGHADRTCAYSFAMIKEADGWYLDADLFERSISKRAIDTERANEILAIIEDRGIIREANKQKEQKGRKKLFHIPDESVYSLALTFSDGEIKRFPKRQGELETAFYRLVEEKQNK